MIKLNIGCANVRMEGYVGIDKRKTANTDIVMDALEVINHYPLNGIDEIYSGHMLEHLYKKDGAQFITDCYDLLKMGGTLRLELPLIDYLINDCWTDKAKPFQFINILYGMQQYPEDCHRYGYTRESIEELLNDKGFIITKEERGRTGKPNSKNGIMLWCKKVENA